MRLSIRYQLLLPLLTLLLGVIGMSTWTALASASRARQQIDAQINDITTTVQQANYPMTVKVMQLMKGFSGGMLGRKMGKMKLPPGFPFGDMPGL